MVLTLMETFKQERNWLKVSLMVLFLLYLMFILVLFRVHYSIGNLYSIDLPIGIIFAVVVYIEVSKQCTKLDRLASKYIYYGLLTKFFPCLKQGPKAENTQVENPLGKSATVRLSLYHQI